MAQIRIGTAGWTDKSLIDSGWYPPEAANPEQRLRYYARQFRLVEVDSAYYALPAEQTAAAWAARTPDRFTFNVKAFSLFTQHPTPVRTLPADLRFGYRYDDKEIRRWAGDIQRLAEGAAETHVVFNNCYRDYAQVNAGQLAALINS